MTRIAIVDNEKLKDMHQKLHIQGICPVNRTGKECIKIMDDKKLVIDELLCTGCGICPKAAPDAIKIINLPEELKSKPIHRYGENKFVLYSIPTPTNGKVTGILGVNGIGKSTAIKILASVVKPNFGDWNVLVTDYDELISFFKGTEAQGFFEKIKKNEIKVAYKPQQVDLIPKTTKGKVVDLLKKVDEKNNFKKISGELELNDILSNNIEEISGGELQRVAIAATVLKDANLYIFDEPTSYLDIKQRIKISKFIKSLIDEGTSVLVVEHDLIILDYIADLVHLMYGKEDAYGIVSGVKPVRNGINVYLSGYIKEENVRFRDSKIKFAEKPPIKKKHVKEVITSWSKIDKKLGKFELKAGEGAIHKNEIIGILGENGTGKTTFVKILASVLKQDKGEITHKVKVSYKPQYLEHSDALVVDVLKTAFNKYENQIINPLNIAPLSLTKLNELSGGELQRVAIAHCLQQDANLYLLDEPSAYLDSEQRLILSKVIRDFVEHKGASALIVDHDLLFIDYISDKLIVFEGKPAVSGNVTGPFEMEDGMNKFLKELNITLRRDPESNRPRVNKLDSRLDREQKDSGKYYYT
ncbi:ribosome biogenesis/translation initiation ATPase RLI [Candidatus Woesearchaeota archaeon]|jgi:ATP-binding cassette subfamily E protein 1|nr:ribosome biogenesis/translation initiation ATPase RLI [Candidatus Woesearchaeota archaeon]|tara:strand:- start:6204 stop:7958 length:1755 start_codon:yes stop_codon:yes gene_type:complete